MAREGWEQGGTVEEKSEKAREGGKTVRFVSSETCDRNERTPVEPTVPQSPVSMVQSLVPHLPGLDKDTIYVISGEQTLRHTRLARIAQLVTTALQLPRAAGVL